MADTQQAMKILRDTIAGIIADREVWTTLYDVCCALGLSTEENAESLGKYRYLCKVTSIASDDSVILAASRILNSYPGTRSRPSDADLQTIQDALWWIESQGVQRISNVTRYRMAESLDGVAFWGRLSIKEFLLPVLPAALNQSLPDIGVDGNLYEDEGLDSTIFSTFLLDRQSKPAIPLRLSALAYLQRIGLAEWPDQRFCLLAERIIHPEVQSTDKQQKLAECFNGLLQQDAFEIWQEDLVGGFPVYKIRKCRAGVTGAPKYLVFASTGLKPDIVINDVVNMDIRIVRHADKCLIYDQPPPNGDLTWQMLLDWWGKIKRADSSNAELRRDFGMRLRASLQSEPERMLFDTYFRKLRPKFGLSLPALLPQVYLHYDPRDRKERGKPVLVRQRMDFLLLLRNAVRIVIEIDGIQHYADSDGRASPQRYAEMVAEDRRIKGLGYEIYRFGGAEFAQPEYTTIIVDFFNDLFDRHNIYPETIKQTSV